MNNTFLEELKKGGTDMVEDAYKLLSYAAWFLKHNFFTSVIAFQ